MWIRLRRVSHHGRRPGEDCHQGDDINNKARNKLKTLNDNNNNNCLLLLLFPILSFNVSLCVKTQKKSVQGRSCRLDDGKRISLSDTQRNMLLWCPKADRVELGSVFATLLGGTSFFHYHYLVTVRTCEPTCHSPALRIPFERNRLKEMGIMRATTEGDRRQDMRVECFKPFFL